MTQYGVLLGFHHLEENGVLTDHYLEENGVLLGFHHLEENRWLHLG
jgi:hypothetical protein